MIYEFPLAVLFLVLVVLLSGGLMWWFHIPKKQLKLLLSFSAAYLLSITFSTILPEVFDHGNNNKLHAIVILGGFFLQIILEAFSHGIEHGHYHIHPEKSALGYILPLSASLYIHSFLEGLPLHGTNPIDNPIYWGIILHNIPIAFAYVTLMLGLGIKKKLAWLFLGIFSIITPLGWFTGSFLSNIENLENIHGWALSLTIGIFLHISTTIIFETTENHRYNLQKLITILIGFILGLLPILAHP
ncbi:MAG: ZIP family metal transporter [Flavobacteriales bacterium]|nr:ZIP family metal transporter [Flavobacteriales bacterium]